MVTSDNKRSICAFRRFVFAVFGFSVAHCSCSLNAASFEKLAKLNKRLSVGRRYMSGLLNCGMPLQLIEQHWYQHGVTLEAVVVVIEKVVDELARKWTRLEHGVACDEACHKRACKQLTHLVPFTQRCSVVQYWQYAGVVVSVVSIRFSLAICLSLAICSSVQYSEHCINRWIWHIHFSNERVLQYRRVHQRSRISIVYCCCGCWSCFLRQQVAAACGNKSLP